MDYNQLRDYIQNFRLDNCPRGNQGYNRVLLQLFGFTGHGKSALINSLLYALRSGKFTMNAKSGVFSSGCAVTMERRTYEITPTITVVDNRGFGRMNDFERRMIYAQLGNFLPMNEKVEWKGDYEDFVALIEDSGLDPNYTDFIVPVFVYKVSVTLSEQEMSQMRDFFKNCRNLTGVFPIIVLTHKISGNYFEVEKMFRCLGAEVVVAVENYSKEDQLQTLGRNTDFLTLFKYALDNVTFRMEHPRNPKEERIERKKFLLRYIHDIDMAEKIKEEKVKQDARKPEQAKIYQFRRQVEVVASVADLARTTKAIKKAAMEPWKQGLDEEFMKAWSAGNARLARLAAGEAMQESLAEILDRESKTKKDCSIQ